MTDLEFPSIQYFYHEQRRNGARVELVPSGDPVRFDLGKFLDAIDETTLLVPISQVLFRSAYIVDARAIIEKAHRVGAYVVLDLFQAAGTIPVDVRGLARILLAAVCSSGSAAAQAWGISMCAKICARSCSQRSLAGSRTGGLLRLKLAPSMHVKIPFAI